LIAAVGAAPAASAAGRNDAGLVDPAERRDEALVRA